MGLQITGQKVLPYGKQFPVIATWAQAGGSFAGDSATNGTTDITGTFKKKHKCITNATNIRVAYGNCSNETVNLNNIVVKAAIESSGGAIYKLYFNGRRSVTIEPGAIVWSDPVGINLTRGDTFWTRSYVTVGAGEVMLVSAAAQESGEGHNLVSIGGDGSDKADSGTAIFGVDARINFAPFAITGETVEQVPVIGIIGDSITHGYNEAVPNFDNPYSIIAMGDNYGDDYAHILMAKPGESIQTFATEAGRALRMRLLKGCSHVVCGYGGADVFLNSRSLVQMQADFATVWGILNAMGIKVFQATIHPYTTSSNSWADVDGQTIHANTTVRNNLNDWIRTIPTPLSGYFETADIVESARNSGKWKAVYTTDGIHPKDTTIHSLMAAAINPNVFAL
jgi:hypothetical protein